MDIDSLTLKLDYIIERVNKIEKFIDAFDEIIDKKWKEKKESCLGYQWCVDGIDDFEVYKKKVDDHITEHTIKNEMNEKVLTNRKWIIGLFFTAIITLILMIIKYFIGG